MDDFKAEERKNFMKRKSPPPSPLRSSQSLALALFSTNTFPLASYVDPLKKREEFAVSLRKKKTHEIINAKRRRLQQDGGSQMGPDVQQTNYKGFPKYEDNVPEYISTLSKLCPEAVEDHSLTIVSDYILKKPSDSKSASSPQSPDEHQCCTRSASPRNCHQKNDLRSG